MKKGVLIVKTSELSDEQMRHIRVQLLSFLDGRIKKNPVLSGCRSVEFFAYPAAKSKGIINITGDVSAEDIARVKDGYSNGTSVVLFGNKNVEFVTIG